MWEILYSVGRWVRCGLGRVVPESPGGVDYGEEECQPCRGVDSIPDHVGPYWFERLL